MLNNHIN